MDLLQLTMSRMQKAESDARFLSSELKEKVNRIAILEEKVHLYEKAIRMLKNQMIIFIFEQTDFMFLKKINTMNRIKSMH